MATSQISADLAVYPYSVVAWLNVTADLAARKLRRVTVKRKRKNTTTRNQLSNKLQLQHPGNFATQPQLHKHQ
jgi:hypothetical protein